MTQTLLKLLAAILMCFIIYILLVELTSVPTHKYRIISGSHGYKTDKYEAVNPNCIKFVDGHNQTVTICGEYQIIENK